jgi:histidinol-phosphate phosphatase family protein
VLAPIAGRPVVTYLLDTLAAAGVRRVVISTGYRADDVERVLGQRYAGLELVHSREDRALGTAGAARLALDHVTSDIVIITNGDSYCEVDLRAMTAAHRARQARGTLLLTRDARGRAFGSVDVDDTGRVVQFREKSEHPGAFVSAGLYIFDRSLLEELPPAETMSFERDVFPRRAAARELHGFTEGGRFLDIGTPDTYKAAAVFFEAVGLVRRRWALLDRDGTIIVDRNHLTDAAKVELLPGSADGIRRLRALGLSIGVVTNQSVVGLGMIDEAGVERIHQRMIELLESEGAHVDAIVFCPHTPDAGCRCRKPEIGLIERLGSDRPLDADASFVVGDDWKDIELGRRIGATTILVRTGHGSSVLAAKTTAPDHVAGDLLSASTLIASRLGG